MEVSIQNSVFLKLTQQEAQWLKALMQNPLLDYEYLDEEPKQDREIRLKFWNALKDVY